MNTGTKTNVPVDYDSAQRIFAKLVKEKKSKGYTEGQDATPYQHSEQQPSGILPQLLNPIDEAQALDLVQDDNWCMQEKQDGRRLIIRKRGQDIIGINKKGNTVGLPLPVFDVVRGFDADVTIDGESIGDHLYAFDLLEMEGVDIRSWPYRERLAALMNLLFSVQQRTIKLVDTAFTTEQKLAFLVDFQTRTDEFYIEALRRIHAGDIGKIAFAEGIYHADSPWVKWYDALSKNPTDPDTRLHAWGLDKVLSGDIITEQNIHTLDVVNWLMGAAPRHAVGSCGLTSRPKIGSCADHFSCYFQFPDSVGVTFSSKQFNGYDTKPDGIRVRAFGQNGVLESEYGGNVMIRGDNYYRGGKSPGIYAAGARANIATFYAKITSQNFTNVTVAPSVQSTLITILGRTAAYRGELVTWKNLLAANERLVADLNGLKD